MSGPKYQYDNPASLEDHIDDFDFHCDAKGTITADQKRGMFMETLDNPTKRSLREWLAPTLTPRTASYEQIVAKLREKIKPSVNNFVAWANFTRRKQQPGETGAAFHADLKRLAAPCGFEGTESKLVPYQFVTGLRNQEKQESLLSKHADLTLTEALQAVTSSEESVESARVVRGPQVEEIHRVETRRPRNGKSPPPHLICFRCGEENAHTAKKCPKPWHTFKCTKCGRGRHLAKACRQRSGPAKESHDPPPRDEPRQRAQRTNYLSSRTDEEDGDSGSEGLFVVRSETSISESDVDLRPATEIPDSDEVLMPPIFGNVTINGRTLEFEIDSGASRSIISHATFLSLYTDAVPSLYPPDVRQVSWGKERTIRTIGRFFTRVQFKGIQKYLPVTVGEGSGPNLLGRNWFSPLGLRIEGIYNLEEIAPENPNHIPTIQELLQLPAVTGDGTGCYRGPPLHLDLDPTVRPVYQRARRVRFALTTKMNEAIDANVKKGIWAPMRYAGSWASALVPVPKKNGTLRLCADYIGTVNPALPADSYRTSTNEEIFARLSGGKVFAEIDLEEAYQQCRVDDETSRVLAVNTVRGLFRVLRLPYGVSLAPSAFQRVIDGLTGGLEGVVAYQDNIYVTAQDTSQLRKRVYNLLKILGDAGLKVNAEKCRWEADCIEVLGFRFDADGRRPLPDRVDAIKRAPAPTCKKELQSLLGLIQFYSYFFKNKSTLLEPLHRLLDNGVPWTSTASHDVALQAIKDCISSDDVLAHYTPDAELFLTCDASPYGVGAVLARQVIKKEPEDRGSHMFRFPDPHGN